MWTRQAEGAEGSSVSRGASHPALAQLEAVEDDASKLLEIIDG